MCLQEVSVRTVGANLECGLAKLGYTLVPNAYYAQKSDLSKWSRRALVNHHQFWSVMTAFRASKFSLVAHEQINYFYVDFYDYRQARSTRK